MTESILLERFREACNVHHERLHIHPVLAHLADNTVTTSYYLQALKGFYGFYAALEPRYAASTSALKEEFPANIVTQRLAHDLDINGIAASTLHTMSPKDGHTPFTNEQVLAYLYLREGSNLGGKFISQNLKNTLGLNPGEDNLFFWGYGQDAGKIWKNFKTALQEASSAVDHTVTADYAAGLFLQLDRWLTQNAESI